MEIVLQETEQQKHNQASSHVLPVLDEEKRDAVSGTDSKTFHPGRLIGLQYSMTRTEPQYRPCYNEVHARVVVAMVSLHIHGRMTLIFRRGFPGSLSHVGTGDA